MRESINVRARMHDQATRETSLHVLLIRRSDGARIAQRRRTLNPRRGSGYLKWGIWFRNEAQQNTGRRRVYGRCCSNAQATGRYTPPLYWRRTDT
jgi:hypothetical protein